MYIDDQTIFENREDYEGNHKTKLPAVLSVISKHSLLVITTFTGVFSGLVDF